MKDSSQIVRSSRSGSDSSTTFTHWTRPILEGSSLAMSAGIDHRRTEPPEAYRHSIALPKLAALIGYELAPSPDRSHDALVASTLLRLVHVSLHREDIERFIGRIS